VLADSQQSILAMGRAKGPNNTSKAAISSET
jgi:hypothetical protein